MGIKKNFVYSSILTIANYIFPLLTYPYVSRVLGVTNIGICNFVDSIIHYFILFSMMGISALGIREIAGASNDYNKRSKIFSSLFALNAITTLIMLVILIFSIYLVPEFGEYKELMYVGAAKLLANLFLVEWFFKGTENFKYITNRTIFVKCIYVISVFLFVKDASDYPIYFLLLALMVIVNAVVNFPYACSKVKLSLKGVSITPYVKTFFVMGCYMLLTSMYTSFNVAYLGFAAGEEQVGYYTTATKIFSIILSLYTAFTGVMMPRMSALYAEGNMDEFRRLINNSIQLLFSFAIPAVIFTIIFAPEIIYLISGEGYEGAYLPARIIMPLIFIIGYEQILVMQILMPAKQDKIVLRNSILGALVGVGLNILLVHEMQCTGSALTWILSEFVVFMAALHGAKHLIGLSFPWKQLGIKFLWYVPIIVILFFVISCFSTHTIINLILGMCVMSIYMFLVLYYVEKNIFFIRLVNKMLLKNEVNI